MRRLAVTAAVALVLPIVAWRAVSAEPHAVVPAVPPACDPTTTIVPPTSEVPDGCVDDPGAIGAPAPTVAVPAEPPGLGTDTTSTTTTIPAVDPNAPTTTVDPNATTTTTDPNATTTVPIDPNTTSTTTVVPVDPNTTSTTTVVPVDPNVTSTTVAAVDPNVPVAPPVDPSAPVPSTVPVPVEDVVSAPMVVPAESEGGRVFVPVGVAETGQVRPVTFPVAGPVRYSNDFGACRDSCRRQHKGNDLIGDRLQPLLAMRDGVVARLLDHPTAGFGVVIRDGDGWEYHQYHMNNDTPGTDDGADDGSWRFASGVVAGARVTAGQVIGWMGDSGNSEGSVPHTHVEIHTPDGTAINPFWSLRMAQRDVNCAIPTITEPAPAALASPVETVETVDAAFLESGWAMPELLDTLPGEWTSLSLTGGQPGSGATAARLWVGPAGFTPVDAAALRVGDARYDEDCSQPSTVLAPAAIPVELGAILATIRAMETGGNYTTQVTSSTASGAYGFLDSSWGGYGGFRRARDAPPPVQDAKAAELATSILARNSGDVSTIPVSWYIGHVPRGSEWDTVPTVGNNKLTPREYQSRWLRRYAQILGTPEAWVGTAPNWAPVDTSVTCRTVVVDLGQPGQAEFALTQTHAMAADASGRAVLAATDPCDPNRPTPEPPPATDVPSLRPGGTS